MSDGVKCPCCEGSGRVTKEYDEAAHLIGGVRGLAAGRASDAMNSALSMNNLKKTKRAAAIKLMTDFLDEMSKRI